MLNQTVFKLQLLTCEKSVEWIVNWDWIIGNIMLNYFRCVAANCRWGERKHNLYFKWNNFSFLIKFLFFTITKLVVKHAKTGVDISNLKTLTNKVYESFVFSFSLCRITKQYSQNNHITIHYNTPHITLYYTKLSYRLTNSFTNSHTFNQNIII